MRESIKQAINDSTEETIEKCVKFGYEAKANTFMLPLIEKEKSKVL